MEAETSTPPTGMPGGALVAELSRWAPLEGGNTGGWPGLTIDRFTSPAGPTWEEIRFCPCASSPRDEAVTVDGATYEYDPFRFLVLNSHLHFQAEILLRGDCAYFLRCAPRLGSYPV